MTQVIYDADGTPVVRMRAALGLDAYTYEAEITARAEELRG